MAWGRAPVVGEDAAGPVPGGRGTEDDLRHSVRHPYPGRTAGPGSCSGHRRILFGCY